MKTGKIPERVLDRSVIKQIRHNRPEILSGAKHGEDCTVIDISGDEVFAVTSDPLIADFYEGADPACYSDAGYLAVSGALNDLAASGAEPIGILLDLLLPAGYGEQDLKRIIGGVERACRLHDIELSGGHTEITSAVRCPIYGVTGMGRVNKDRIIRTGGAEPGDDIIITGYTGLKGTYLIAEYRKEDLLERFSSSFIDRVSDFIDDLCVLKEAGVKDLIPVSFMHDVSKGGIFAALWELGKASGCGLSVDLKKIPLRQETVEICEYFGLNPYELDGTGSLLITTKQGKEAVRALNAMGINASLAGKITKNNDRVIINGEEKRFLIPPENEELSKIFGNPETQQIMDP
ncbi:MAG: AIR synthase family protein [Lachnospiraceae bacterium]|nr:AIR synthase family protein [Lachnospiraceae bacterium]